jgi:hypothetical protein
MDRHLIVLLIHVVMTVTVPGYMNHKYPNTEEESRQEYDASTPTNSRLNVVAWAYTA